MPSQAEVAEVGAVRVIVDLLIAATVGTSDGTRMVMAVLRLANALLEGGNRKVQDAIHRYARYGTSGGNFFEARLEPVCTTLQKSINIQPFYRH